MELTSPPKKVRRHDVKNRITFSVRAGASCIQIEPEEMD